MVIYNFQISVLKQKKTRNKVHDSRATPNGREVLLLGLIYFKDLDGVVTS